MAQMEKGKSCGACHNGKGAFKVGECAKCHKVKEKTYAVKDAGNVLFSHTFHTGMYSCAECHPHLYSPGNGNATVSMAGMEAQKSCGACHDGKTAFTVKENCEKCHKMDKG
jgi:c(7)-type cytochrome triheme protein